MSGNYPHGRRIADLAAITPGNLAPAANLRGHWPFNGSLDDFSGNGYHLAVVAGSVAYVGQGPGGRRALSLQGGTRLELANPADNAAFRLLGEMCVVLYMRPTTTAAGYVITCSSPTSGAEADNSSFELLREAEGSGQSGGCSVRYQHGVGSTLANQYAKLATVERHTWEMVAVSRTVPSGTSTDLIVSGHRAMSTTANANLPTGGGNARLTVGAHANGTTAFYGAVADLMIFDTAPTFEQIQAEARRVGVYGGN